MLDIAIEQRYICVCARMNTKGGVQRFVLSWCSWMRRLAMLGNTQQLFDRSTKVQVSYLYSSPTARAEVLLYASK